MMNYTIEQLNDRLQKAEQQTENQEGDYEQLVYDLQQDVEMDIGFIEEVQLRHPEFGLIPDDQLPHSLELRGLKIIIKEIQRIKREHDFFDSEAELDMMFPERHDDDFDEDSMSYDSLFGGD
ncbi:MAG: hypothetical protein H6584_06330 [Flavobacteriales bacterium]|nr:hypothetical protein [Flavobacteriales bacterium]